MTPDLNMDKDKITENRTNDGVNRRITTRKIQSQGRVEPLMQWFEDMGLEEGDQVHMMYEDGVIKIAEVSVENVNFGDGE